MKNLFLILSIAYTIICLFMMKPTSNQMDLFTYNGMHYGISLSTDNLLIKLSVIFLWIGYYLFDRKK